VNLGDVGLNRSGKIGNSYGLFSDDLTGDDGSYITISPSGKLYLINDYNLLVSNRALGLPAFDQLDPGATLNNIGNLPLVWTDPNKLYTESGNGAAAINIVPTSEDGCNAGTPIAAGAFCNLSISFTPTGSGTFTDTLHFLTNASNNETTALKLTASKSTVTADVVVYGATPSGIAAAIEAAHLGKKVLLLEPGQHVGGITSSGLGTTDMYTQSALGGLVKTFFSTVASIYGPANTDTLSGTRYEPHVAEQAFNQMLAQQKTLQVVFNATLSSIAKNGTVIASLTASNGTTYVAKVFIDASYEGDLMAAAKVSYTVGREATTKYNESIAGVWKPSPMGDLTVDPYVTPGSPSSGLLQHIESTPLGAPGSADTSVMAYTYRLCVSKRLTNQIPFSAPVNYDPMEFELLGRYGKALTASGRAIVLNNFLLAEPLPNSKLDINNNGGFSTDNVAANTEYPNGSAATRQQIIINHKHYVQGLLYFLATDPRIPKSVQATVKSWGLCKDEFMDNGGWPRQLYVREARRMTGVYVITQFDAQNKTSINNSIGLGGYPFDNHLQHRVAVDGKAQNEAGKGITRGTTPYRIPYGALNPRPSQATNLLVSVAISASHVALESLRIEPTYMIMGQAAGAAASLAIDANANVQDVKYSTLAKQLTADGQVLTVQ